MHIYLNILLLKGNWFQQYAVITLSAASEVLLLSVNIELQNLIALERCLKNHVVEYEGIMQYKRYVV